MKLNITCEILFLILIASLNEFVAGQSLLSLDLHKQSRRTKQLVDLNTTNLLNQRQRPLPLQRLKRQFSGIVPIERSAQVDDELRPADEASEFVAPNTPDGLSEQHLSSSSTSIPSNTNLVEQSSGKRQESINQTSSEGEESSSSSNGNNQDENTINGQTTTTTTSAPSSSSRQQPSYEFGMAAAELCYLANGGSSLTLTVNEATQVGASIGSLDVNGDPSLEGGNVHLQVEGEGGGWPSEQTGGGGERSLMMQTSSHFTSAAGGNAQLLPGGGSARQIRRLLGRRDTSTSARQAASLTQSHLPTYSLVATSGATASANGQNLTTQTSTTLAGPALRLEPGSRELLLARPLDKESAEGESSLVVNVRCWPRRRQLPVSGSAGGGGGGADERDYKAATTIPIRLIITDANDHAPEFVGTQPYVLNVSETLAPGNALNQADGQIQAHDRDLSAGPHSTIHYKVLQNSGAPLESKTGANLAAQSEQQQAAAYVNLSQHFAFNNPLEPVLWLTKSLDYEQLPSSSFLITILAQDQAEPEPLQSTAQVQINVLDFDDQNPRFLDEKYTLIMDEQQSNAVGQTLRILPRPLRAEDGDRGIMAPINYSFDSQSGAFLASNRLLDAFGSPGPAGAPSSLASVVAATQLTANNGNLQPISGDGYGAELLANIESYLHLNPTTGELRLIRQWPSGGGGGAGGPITLLVRATQADNRDRYALTALTITRQPMANKTTNKLEGDAGGQALDRKQPGGIGFLQDRVLVQVPEDMALNEKLVKVRAHHLNLMGATDQQQRDLLLLTKQNTRSSQTSRVSGDDLALEQINLPNSQINYQILDDQLDQFGITALGEIFLKRPLDFEQRQEFKLRILATSSKHSDICHVQIKVLNVNDNKPKFTQAQYSFHLTESRLRTNSVGVVQALDADLNDTIKYSILLPTNQTASSSAESQCARLFEFSSITSGQINLKAGLKQLNVSQCQLVVEASDSLGPIGAQHKQQARVTIHISSQLIGRSIISLQQQQQQQHEETNRWNSAAAATSLQHSKSSRGRQMSLSGGSGDSHQGDASTASSVIVSYEQTHQQAPPSPPPSPSSQRSSLATVMASLQHMVRGTNLFEMPVSSALLLALLLAFLVCLLLLVVISMSVHVYRRRSKARRRRHLAATAHLRHAHLANLTGPPNNGKPLAYATASAASVAAAASSSSLNQAKQNQQAFSSSSAASYTTNTTSTSASPTCSSSSSSSSSRNSNNELPQEKRQVGKKSSKANKSTNNTLIDGVATKAKKGDNNDQNEAQQAPNGSNDNDTAANSATAQVNGQPRGIELKISTELEILGEHGGPGGLGTYLKSAAPLRSNGPVSHSLISSLTTTTNNTTTNTNSRHLEGPISTTLSTDEDDNSSLVHCGHYSVNGTIEHRSSRKIATNTTTTTTSNQQQVGPNTTSNQMNETTNLQQQQRNSNTSRLLSEIKCELAQQQKQKKMQQQQHDQAAQLKANPKLKKQQQQQQLKQTNKTKSSIEAAIRSLARQEREVEGQAGDQEEEDGDAVDEEKKQQATAARRHQLQPSTKSRLINSNRMTQQPNCDESEVCELTAPGRPGIKSYRRLPLMDSLARTSGRAPRLGASRVAPLEKLTNKQQQQQQREPPAISLADQQGGALMALVRESSAKSTTTSEQQRQLQIRWPSGALPQRTKRLTWDDELSCCQDEGQSPSQFNEMVASPSISVELNDCYIAPDVRLAGPISPLSREHHYSDPRGQFQAAASGYLNAIGGAPIKVESHNGSQPSSTFTTLDRCLQSATAAVGRSYSNSSNLQNMNCRNNCLDYTIVQTSQFHVDSLTAAAAATVASASSSSWQQQQQQQPSHLMICDEDARDYLYSANKQTNNSANSNLNSQHVGRQEPSDGHYYYAQHPMGELQQVQPSGGGDGQLDAIHKLNQNFQDLKLMTTAVL